MIKQSGVPLLLTTPHDSENKRDSPPNLSLSLNLPTSRRRSIFKDALYPQTPGQLWPRRTSIQSAPSPVPPRTNRGTTSAGNDRKMSRRLSSVPLFCLRLRRRSRVVGATHVSSFKVSNLTRAWHHNLRSKFQESTCCLHIRSGFLLLFGGAGTNIKPHFYLANHAYS